MKRIDILLAMGSPALLAITEKALLEEGLSVIAVSNGIDAVTTAFSMKPRCVLCGQILPGIDGIKVCRFLNTQYTREQIPVIISAPEINPKIRRMALSASAVAVVDYSMSLRKIIKLVKLHLSSVGASSISTGIQLSSERIMSMVADSLEGSLDAIETVVALASDLAGVTSILEASRKTIQSILVGLGFQRVWIGIINSSSSAVEAVAFRGRGITGESIPLSGIAGHLPVDTAVVAGVQVASWEPEFRDNRETWVGSVSYVDTPLKTGSKVYGVIRCDNGISKKQPSDITLCLLRMLADELSSFIKYLDTQNRIEYFGSTFEQMFSSLSSWAIIFTAKQTVENVYGDADKIPGIKTISTGMSLSEVLTDIPLAPCEVILNAATERREVELSSVPLNSGKVHIGLYLIQQKSGGMILVVSDHSAVSDMENKVKLLEMETDTIASLAADLTSLMDPAEICRTLFRTLQTFYPTESITVLSAHEITSSITPDRLIVHATSESGNRGTSVLPGITLQVRKNTSEPGVVAEAVKTGRVINIPDVLQSDIFIAHASDIRSELAMPMISRGRIIGAVDIASTQISRFKGDDIKRLNNILGFASGVLETALQQTELIKLARHDRLTGLYNMTFFEERYPEEFERAERYEYSFSLIMMDIDDFKHYNDSFGHPMGNVLLQKLTRAMIDALRDVDILIRYGGEEFVCILPLTDKQVAEDIAERIRVNVIEVSRTISNASEQPRGFVSLSLGVAAFPVDSRSKDELLEIADQRMYKAKRAGKNRVCSS